MPEIEKMIETEALSKSFMTEAGELRVLRDINFAIYEGQITGITGASGAGKSTLLHILGALDKPSSGRVLFRGEDISSMDENNLARFRNRHIGFVFQFHHLLPEFNAVENVMMPSLIHGTPFAVAEQKASSLLASLGLAKRLKHRPGELSGGEQQRVAVARALVENPQVVLADEPTGNLDTATGNDLFELLLDLNRRNGISFVIVTHNQELSRRCHRVLGMADGTFVSGM